MSDRKVKNISSLTTPILVRVLNENGDGDIVITLSSNESFWCPMNRETMPMIIYEKRGYLLFQGGDKPSDINYYSVLSDVSDASKPNIESELISESIDNVATSSEIKKKNIKEKKPSNKNPINVIDGENQNKGIWENKDIEWLKNNYPSHGLAYCSSYLNRTEASVKKKVGRLKIKREK